MADKSYTNVQIERAAKALYEHRYGSVSDYVWKSLSINNVRSCSKSVEVVIEALHRGE